MRSNSLSWSDEPNENDVFSVANFLNTLNENESDPNDASDFNAESDTVKLPFSEKFSPKKNEDRELITDGVFGSPSAIFARLRKDDNGYIETGFNVPYHWIKIEYVKDDNGEIVLDEDHNNALIESAEFLPLDTFLDERKGFLESRPELTKIGGGFYWPAFKERMEELNSIRSGDVVVVSDGREGYLLLDNEGDSYRGWHGGPTVSESYVPLFFSMPGESLLTSKGEVGIPERLDQGYKTRLKANGEYSRNYQLGEFLKAIHSKFKE